MGTMAANGRLPQSALAPITKAVNGEQAYLRKDVARAFMAMNEESEDRFGVTLRVSSARVAYRSFVQQQYFWNLYQHHGGALAAVPGQSNHGLGLAVDLATQQMRQIVDKIGEKYGFAKKWSDAQSEWWHIKWREGYYKAVSEYVPFRTIRKGSKPGKDIEKVQVYLRASGFLPKRWKVHSKYTLYVRTAVRAYQRSKKIKADGVIGPATLKALKSSYAYQTKKK